eukprot:CAMPEP_0117839644 /NCGR_PEP_ID=MMETSP0949-20121206/14124_1 /TAXON_ID=44440 /ORGANISM="Chattonella subsalsa, Strain CCMP2191" /LENGTH=95 /DNA_ID=CAMNT_0005682705 /DNA_START=77 /DNA_END=361 /DNA_ORIENTATION=+
MIRRKRKSSCLSASCMRKAVRRAVRRAMRSQMFAPTTTTFAFASTMHLLSAFSSHSHPSVPELEVTARASNWSHQSNVGQVHGLNLQQLQYSMEN